MMTKESSIKQVHNLVEGDKINNWKIVSKFKKNMWLVQCDCGNQDIRRASDLCIKTKSCFKCRSSNNIKHGFAKHPNYSAYRSMLKKCYNPQDPSYHLYGERGVKVCDRWKANIEHFIADLGEIPKGYGIILIDSTKDYSPDNCRITPKSEILRVGALKKRTPTTSHVMEIESIINDIVSKFSQLINVVKQQG